MFHSFCTKNGCAVGKSNKIRDNSFSIQSDTLQNASESPTKLPILSNGPSRNVPAPPFTLIKIDEKSPDFYKPSIIIFVSKQFKIYTSKQMNNDS
jgi:hypothetical protein